MKRKLESADMQIGAEIEVKPKSTQFSLGKLFTVMWKVNEHCGVGYATHYTLKNNETGHVFHRGWPLSSIREHFHKVKVS